MPMDPNDRRAAARALMNWFASQELTDSEALQIMGVLSGDIIVRNSPDICEATITYSTFANVVADIIGEAEWLGERKR